MSRRRNASAECFRLGGMETMWLVLSVVGGWSCSLADFAHRKSAPAAKMRVDTAPGPKSKIKCDFWEMEETFKLLICFPDLLTPLKQHVFFATGRRQRIWYWLCLVMSHRVVLFCFVRCHPEVKLQSLGFPAHMFLHWSSCLLQNWWRTQMLSYSLIDLIRHDFCTTQTFRRRGTGRKLSARHGRSAFHGRGHMAESMVWPCGPWHLIPQSTRRTTGVNWDVTGAVTAVLKPLGIIGIIGVMGWNDMIWLPCCTPNPGEGDVHQPGSILWKHLSAFWPYPELYLSIILAKTSFSFFKKMGCKPQCFYVRVFTDKAPWRETITPLSVHLSSIFVNAEYCWVSICE
jgi:hypothetical protein